MAHLDIADAEVDADSPITTGLMAKYRDNAAYGKTAFAYKTVIETLNNDDTLQDDDHLFFTIADKEVWEYSFAIKAELKVASDLQIQLTHPGGSGYFSVRLYRALNAATTMQAVIHATTGAPVSIVCSVADSHLLHIDGVFTATATGAFKLQWAQDTAVAEDTQFRENVSFVLAHRVSGW